MNVGSVPEREQFSGDPVVGPDSAGPDLAATGIDTSTAHPAHVYDCFLGGRDRFPADRAVAKASKFWIYAGVGRKTG